MSERLRHFAAWAGLLWWLVYPFAYFAGLRARWSQRCAGRTFTGEFDDCYNDALPIVELLAFPLTFILAYPFARFAFSMFGPAAEERSFKWRLAASSAAAAYSPWFQIVATAGFVWAALHLVSLPLTTEYWYLLAYWALWIGWFSLGAFVSSRFADRAQLTER